MNQGELEHIPVNWNELKFSFDMPHLLILHSRE